MQDELEANKTAIDFSLIEPQELADFIVKRISLRPIARLGASEMLDILWDFLTHPFVSEQLQNIGFEIKRPIETQRIASRK